MAGERMPDVDLAPGTCPRCGASNAVEAGDRCEIGIDVGGDAYCLGGAEEGPDPTLLYWPTPESLKRLDDHYAALAQEGRTDD